MHNRLLQVHPVVLHQRVGLDIENKSVGEVGPHPLYPELYEEPALP